MKLYEHQKAALEQTKSFADAAYYLDMGLGKTFVGSEKMNRIGNFANLVVCQKSKINDWKNHFEKYYPNYKIFDLTQKASVSDFVGDPCTKIGVINYDLIFRRDELLKLKNFTLMLDESSLIANSTSKRTRAIMKMKPANVILLSGTPANGKYESLWTQAKLLGWNITKKTYFQHYIVTEKIRINNSGFEIPVVVGYKNEERLRRKLKEHGAVFMKTEECFDLPEVTDIPVYVPPTKEYNRFLKDRIVQMKDRELIGDTSLTTLLRCRELCGIYSKDKQDAVGDILDSCNDRVIIYYNFDAEMKILQDLIVKHGGRVPAILNGKCNELSTFEMIDNSVLLVQYQAGAMGLNLQMANKIVYYTLPLRSDLFEQSKKRIHRIGQNRACFYYYLICRGTVEERIMQTLNMRRDYDLKLFEKDEK